MHGNAKEQTEISNEKEMLEQATIQTIGKNRYGNVTKDGLEETLEEIIGIDNIEVMPDGEKIVITFKESNRSYQVDEDGNIEEFTIYIDTTPGELAKEEQSDENGNKITIYKIESIEDLVVFSIATNGGNVELGISSNNFANQNVTLERDLDFNSNFSYNDYKTTLYGDLNQDGIIDDIKTELTKTENECTGFTGIKNFQGIFDGNSKMISNIYENTSATGNNGGIFRYSYYINCSNVEIKNLSISGTIISKGMAAGICSTYASYGIKITNCKNYAKIRGTEKVGGITDWSNKEVIEKCKNYGNLECDNFGAYGGVGGMTGYANATTFNNCENFGNTNDSNRAGGIVGVIDSCNINNCLNSGKNFTGGIVAWVRSGEDTNITNCCNLGECNNGIIGSVHGASYNSNIKLSIQSCYNIGRVSNTGIIGNQGSICLSLTLNIENCYNAGESRYAIIGTITDSNQNGFDITVERNIKNTYYDKSKSTNIGAMTEGITPKTENEMKQNSFVTLLNADGEFFVLDSNNTNKGYPILSWQNEVL